MRFWLRRGALVWMLAVGALTTATGCKHDGAYQLSWSFTAEGQAQAVSALDCARHGVFSVRISAIATSSVDTVAVPCSPATLTRSIAADTWAFEVRALDSDGKYRGDLLRTALPSAATALSAKLEPTEIAGEQTVKLAVQLPPLPKCADGVDNDSDGRIDVDDPDCAGALGGDSEGPEPAGSP